jgi:hypothetical protein
MTIDVAKMRNCRSDDDSLEGERNNNLGVVLNFA